MRPLCSHAPSAPGRARFQLCSGAKGSTGAVAGWTTLMALSHAGNPRAVELLKFGYMRCISNDIRHQQSRNATAASSGSSVQSDARRVRLGRVSWPHGSPRARHAGECKWGLIAGRPLLVGSQSVGRFSNHLLQQTASHSMTLKQ